MIALTLFELLLFQAERLQVTGNAARAALQDGGEKTWSKTAPSLPFLLEKKKQKTSAILGTITL